MRIKQQYIVVVSTIFFIALVVIILVCTTNKGISKAHKKNMLTHPVTTVENVEFKPVVGSELKINDETLNYFYLKGRSIYNSVESNRDVIGTLIIPGITLEEEFVYSLDKEKYLRQNSKLEYSESGSIFMGLNCDITLENNANVVLYGQNVGNGKAFSRLEEISELDITEEPLMFIYQDSKLLVYSIIGRGYVGKEVVISNDIDSNSMLLFDSASVDKKDTLLTLVTTSSDINLANSVYAVQCKKVQEVEVDNTQ